MPTTHLLYLHGFRSSPQSFKARTLGEYVQQHHPHVQWYAPQLPPSPQAAMAQVMAHVADWPSAHMAVVGSSLGGFYASYVAHHKRCKAVFMNPATRPYETLERYIGEQTSWHEPQEAFFFQRAYIQELRDLDVHAHPAAGPQLGIFTKGDEVLNWQDMVARYPQAQQMVLEGGDHAISDFPVHLPRVVEFLDLA